VPGRKKIKIRRTWLINPKTRIKESKKVYKRSREKQRIREEIKRLDEQDS